MSKIVGLRGLGDDAAAPVVPMPPGPPSDRPPFTLAGVALVAGSMALVGYIFWSTLRGPKARRTGFARNGRRRYRKKRVA